MIRSVLTSFALLLALVTSVSAAPIRLKDLVEFDGVRSNDLVGYAPNPKPQPPNPNPLRK